MSFNFKKHNPKSFVVRGDIIENLKSRQQLISKLSGKCVYNTKLKFGNGLLVPINEKNEEVLNEYKLLDETNNSKNEERLKSVIVPYEKNDDKNNLDDILLKLLNESETDEEEKNETNFNKSIDGQNTTFEIINDKISSNKNSNNLEKKIKISKNQHKEKQVSIIDNKMSEEKDYKKNDRSSKSLSRFDRREQKDTQKDTQNDKKDLRKDEKRLSDKRSDNSERNSQKRDTRKSDRYERRSHKHRHDSSSESCSDSDSSDSSEYSGDSSEDERIQETIRRKGQRPDRKKVELNDSDVDSDHEDIVTLSRRVRYLIRKIKSIENFIR